MTTLPVTKVEWSSLPPIRRTKRLGAWWKRLMPLVGHTERWAVVKRCPTATTAAQTVWQLRTKRYKIPPGEWAFASRTESGEYRVYACYVGLPASVRRQGGR